MHLFEAYFPSVSQKKTLYVVIMQLDPETCKFSWLQVLSYFFLPTQYFEIKKFFVPLWI